MASSEEEPEQPKLCIPTLVLHRICEFLCKHCEPQQVQDGTHPAAACRQSKMTLKNLCEVSKTLRFIAEPILYHYWKGTFEPQTPSARTFALSAIRFLSRLHTRPQLRTYVRALDIRDCTRDQYSRDPCIISFEEDFRVSKLKLDLAPRRCLCMDCSHRYMEIDDAKFERRAERLLIGATAPHLKSLICTSGSLKEDLDMPQLDSLRVDIRHSWPNEQAFLGNLKCLRRLSFQSSCPISSRFTLESSTTIEELSIGFGRDAWRPNALDRVQFDEPIEFAISELNHFTNLKWLSIYVEAICSTKNLEDEIGAEIDIETFIFSLPDSLEILHIDMTGERGDPEDIFRSILAASSARSFKNLKAILWSPDEMTWDTNFRIVRPETNPEGRPQWSIVIKENKKKLGQPENEFFPSLERLLAK
ncbi:unnamed protein product [Clonostachys solani]|uniref:Uncharacterized protein n=1 Tax=Clonostachys solani TaxID=160281 RepID=A0A9P0EKY9_9HYPO|nr:unnamed protein product [Clonostachys solani]